jgi:hypothetical protein
VYTRPLSWILAVSLASVAVAPARGDGLSFTVNSEGDKRIESCSDLEMTFWKDDRGTDGIVTLRSTQTVALGSDASKALKVVASDRGGIRVQPSLDGSFAALVCMAAGARSNDAAQGILDGLRIENRDGELTVKGPEDADWAAEIVLSVPAGATLDLSATNGGLQLRDVDGHFALRTTNGPIDLTHASGRVDAQAENGPIHYRGHSGDVTLAAQNGPIGVDLDAPEWAGKGLDASTQNGPIQLSAPNSMKSGVEVMGSRSSPATWNGTPQPIQAQGSGSRRYHFGGDPIVVRLSTVNGPVEIKAPKQRKTRGVTI